MSRIYPKITTIETAETVPISFVVIRFSDEYLHNFLKSECVHNQLNEVIEVDNTCNLHFDNLSQAILFGVQRARFDVIVVVHEDVLFPDGWQRRFEQSLRQLEEYDANWGMLGSVGWDGSGEFVGHWSDPHQFKNTFLNGKYTFQQVEKLDEQLLVFHRARLPNLDTNMPGIHFLGEDLRHELHGRGLQSYAIDAPTIHKYADKHGKRIVSRTQSEKISDRDSLTYLADEACCKDYINWKYPLLFSQEHPVDATTALTAEKRLQLGRPIIIIFKGASESALVSKLVQASGVFIGKELDESGESLSLKLPLYKMIIEKYRCHADWQKSKTLAELPSIAAQMIGDVASNTPWGFMLADCSLVLPELRQVFPDARYVYIQRDPLSICLGAAHTSARLDNHIGRIALPEAYEYLKLNKAQIVDDDMIDRMTYTTIHQLELVNQHLECVADSHPLTLRFEEITKNLAAEIQKFSSWLRDGNIGRPSLASRAKRPDMAQPTNAGATKIAVAKQRLSGIREALAYI